MLLAVDIGNTNIHNALFKERLLKKVFCIPSDEKKLQGFYSKWLKANIEDIERVAIVSVVPGVLKAVEKTLKKMLRCEILVVGRNIDAGVVNLYRKPEQVGGDRLVNARAAYDLYNRGAIIVDFGTAITIDIINRKRQYLGGVIAPGVELSVKALSEKAALLPKVTLKNPKVFLGRETKESMISGAIYGFSSLCDGIVNKFKKRFGRDTFIVIATGGMSRLIGPYCETIDKIDPYLTLKGLALIGETDRVR